jgi:hypothetical protein
LAQPLKDASTRWIGDCSEDPILPLAAHMGELYIAEWLYVKQAQAASGHVRTLRIGFDWFHGRTDIALNRILKRQGRMNSMRGTMRRRRKMADGQGSKSLPADENGHNPVVVFN